jgi:ABC-type multidrug transport system ATPase subunit
VIRLRDVSVQHGDVRALALASLDLADGERLGVTGPNGSGKSTLLRVLAGLLRPTAGSVEGLPGLGRAVLVHQRPYLFRGTARENVEYALRLHRRPVSEALSWLERLGASAYADRDAKALSGGERRRVAIARALAVAPSLLLLDEPHSDLDEGGIARLEALLAEFRGTLVLAAPELDPSLVTRVVRLK